MMDELVEIRFENEQG
jgi:hypothetical protein